MADTAYGADHLDTPNYLADVTLAAIVVQLQ
jgi:hypothetical protein